MYLEALVRRDVDYIVRDGRVEIVDDFTGRLMEALAITKTASDQLEMATMLPAEFWKCADESRRAIDALADALGGMKVNASRMAQCANDYWSQASTVVGFLVK